MLMNRVGLTEGSSLENEKIISKFYKNARTHTQTRFPDLKLLATNTKKQKAHTSDKRTHSRIRALSKALPYPQIFFPQTRQNRNPTLQAYRSEAFEKMQPL